MLVNMQECSAGVARLWSRCFQESRAFCCRSDLRALCVQVCEKEKLLTERNQLKACMGELWENFTCLSQEVCRDVQLSQEQMQSLHHYCPVLRPANSNASNNPAHEPAPPLCTTAGATAATTSIDLTTHSGSATPEPSFHGSPGPLENEPDSAVRKRADRTTDVQSGLLLENSNQTVTVDFCQEMTDKCTTDEQPTKDCTQ